MRIWVYLITGYFVRATHWPIACKHFFGVWQWRCLRTKTRRVGQVKTMSRVPELVLEPGVAAVWDRESLFERRDGNSRHVLFLFELIEFNLHTDSTILPVAGSRRSSIDSWKGYRNRSFVHHWTSHRSMPLRTGQHFLCFWNSHSVLWLA